MAVSLTLTTLSSNYCDVDDACANYSLHMSFNNFFSISLGKFLRIIVKVAIEIFIVPRRLGLSISDGL